MIILVKEKIMNIILGLSYSYFVFCNFAFLTYSNDFRMSVLLLTIFNIFLCVNAFFRRPPCRVSFSLFDICITLMGTYSVTFMVGIKTSEEFFILHILGVFGLIISLFGVLSLNKSFGLLPADRGIIKTGIYHFIRHPIYAGYLITNTCFILQNYSHRNIILFSLFVIGEMLRLLQEEKLLCKNPEYLQYTKETKWRIIPGIW